MVCIKTRLKSEGSELATNYYTEGWINQCLQIIEIRKKLTDEWKERGVTQDKDYAILTNEMTKSWSGMTVQEYKAYKGLKKESLRNNMTDIELVI